MKKSVALIFGALMLTAVISRAGVAEGDAMWEKRAEGAQGSHAAAGPIDAAIAQYRGALETSPGDLEARWKLMRALRFKGAYVATEREKKQDIFDEGKTIGEKGMEFLNAKLRAKGIAGVDKASEEKVARAAKSIPGAGEFLYWDAANWGEWALVFGKLAAVRKGAADRIKRESTIVMEMDPAIEGGGGARILGRLHNQTPHVPFITGWASDREAVKFLKQSLAQDPSNKLTKVFLAEAMVAVSGTAKPQAIEMLKEVLASPADPAHAVEHAAAQDEARELLDSWS